MKNRRFLLITGIVLALVMSVSGTVAYLTDSDSDVNTMTLGNVKIMQIEQERDAQGKLVDFTQDKPLMPAVYEGDGIPDAGEEKWPVAGDASWKVVEANKNVVDKFVTVKNDGRSDAYVRTLIAIESDPKSLIHLVLNGEDWTWEENVASIEVDGVDYDVLVATYKTVLGDGETTEPSLKQVYLDKTATNEDLKGWGETYDILVLSQAVQTSGFDGADMALSAGFPYGADKNATIQGWFEQVKAENEKPEDPVEPEEPVTEVATLADLREAVSVSGSVRLTSDIELGEEDAKVEIPEGVAVKLDLGGKKISTVYDQNPIVNNGTLTLTGGTVASGANAQRNAVVNFGVLTVDGATIQAGNWAFAISNSKNSAEMTVKGNAKIVNGISNSGGLLVESGEITSTNDVPWCNNAIRNETTAAEVTITGGNFTSIGDNLNNNGTIVIKGGTFSKNPTSYLTADYQAVRNEDSTWTVTAK